MQKYTSADTSINSTKLPTTFTKFEFNKGTKNFDLGGGRFDNAMDFLRNKGVYKKGDIIIGVNPKSIVLPILFPTDNKGNYLIFK